METVVVGGGLLGLSTAYELAKAGHRVTVVEGGARLGGLATDVEVAGLQVDRFYHCILTGDDHLLGLIEEVGLREQMRMRPVRAGFFVKGRTYSISTPLDLLRFAPLSPIDRFRLGWSLLACRRVKDWRALERVDVESWLRRLSGPRVYELVWRPLLAAKFDGDFRQVPATYIWARTVRMTDTRSAGGAREMAGHLVGGYRTLAERLAERIRERGGEVRLNCPAEGLVLDGERVAGVRAGGATLPCDAAVLTVPLPLAARLVRASGGDGAAISGVAGEYAARIEAVQGYLGVVCLLLVLDRPLSPYYTLYLADRDLPFTAVMETTNLIDPALVEGRTLVYLPKYLAPTNPLYGASDEAIRERFIAGLRRIYPGLGGARILAAPVFRAPHVDPLHPLGSLGSVPPTETPIGGLFVGSPKHFYPRLNSGEAITRLGAEMAAQAVGWLGRKNSAR